MHNTRNAPQIHNTTHRGGIRTSLRHQLAPSSGMGRGAFWDNRAAVHYAVRNYGEYPRVLERILISDERLYADL